MKEVQQEILCALLETLFHKELITQDILDRSKEKVLGIFDMPDFFWENDTRKEDAHGSA